MFARSAISGITRASVCGTSGTTVWLHAFFIFINAVSREAAQSNTVINMAKLLHHFLAFVVVMLIFASGEIDARCFIFYDDIFAISEDDGFIFRLRPEDNTASIISADQLPDFESDIKSCQDSLDFKFNQLHESVATAYQLWENQLRALCPESNEYWDNRMTFVHSFSDLDFRINSLIEKIKSKLDVDPILADANRTGIALGDRAFFNFPGETTPFFEDIDKRITEDVPVCAAAIASFQFSPLSEQDIERIKDFTKYYRPSVYAPLLLLYSEIESAYNSLGENSSKTEYEKILSDLENLKNEADEEYIGAVCVVLPYDSCSWWSSYDELEWKLVDIESDIHWYEDFIDELCSRMYYVWSVASEIPRLIGSNVVNNDYVLNIPENVIYDGVEYGVNNIEGTVIDDSFVEGDKKITLTIPPSIESISTKAFNSERIGKVIAQPHNPPVFPEDAFTQNTYNTAPLFVPESRLATYVGSDWRRFYDIVGITDTKVDDVSEENYKVYAVDGEIHLEGTGVFSVYDGLGYMIYAGGETVLPTPGHGIYIVRMKGKSVKIIL